MKKIYSEKILGETIDYYLHKDKIKVIWYKDKKKISTLSINNPYLPDEIKQEALKVINQKKAKKAVFDGDEILCFVSDSLAKKLKKQNIKIVTPCSHCNGSGWVAEGGKNE